jgi:nucleoside-diphosphate-sugar epimerase
VLTQFLGHIVRGEDIQLVDGGAQTRSFTYVDDAMECMLRIIENPHGVASGKIYNIGNPANNYSIRQLAETMLEIARGRPEYRESARRVRLIEVTSAKYYGDGYQDIQTRVPQIDNTCRDLKWLPRTDMRTALHAIFDAYSEDLQQALELTTTGTFPAPVPTPVAAHAQAVTR